VIAAELQLATIRTGVHIQGADFMAVWKDGKQLEDIGYLQAGVEAMLDQLVWWTKALKTARGEDTLAAAAWAEHLLPPRRHRHCHCARTNPGHAAVAPRPAMNSHRRLITPPIHGFSTGVGVQQSEHQPGRKPARAD
jgi:hypothetical protein